MYPNALKFLIKWFEQGGCKVDAANAYKCAPTVYIIPFLSRQDRDQAWPRAVYLMEQDSSFTIQPWEPEDLRAQLSTSQHSAVRRFNPKTSVFLRNIKADQMSQIRQIFADVGAIDHLVSTSNHTALINFTTETSACKALSSLRPPPADNIQCQPYEERSRQLQPRTQRRAERSHNVQEPLSPAQTTVPSGAQQESGKRRATSDRTHNHSPSQPNPISTSSTNRASKRRASSPSDASKPAEAAMEIDEAPIDDLSQIRNLPTTSGQQSPENNDSGSGGGGDDGTHPTILGLDDGTTRQPSAPPLHPSNAQIRAKWTRTSNKDWVLNTRFLDQYLAAENLRCSTVPADGNCGYHAVIKAGNLKLPFSSLKHQALTYLNENEAQVRSTFQPTTTSNMAEFLETLRHKLSSPGAYTNHYLLQLTAWTLHRNIEIHDIFDTHVMTLSGEPPWLPSDRSSASSTLSTIRIAYRQHQKYWSYDQNFRPINRHDGHYWAIIPCGNQPDREETAARVSTSNYYSPLQSDSTDPAQSMQGNQWRSTPRRR